MQQSYDAVCFDLFGTLVEEDGTAIDGAAQALAAVGGARWSIVTSCGRGFALALLEAAGLPRPPVLVTSDDVLRSKPAPDPYAAAAKQLVVAPERSLAIEDSRQGIAAGRAAGMDVLAILRGHPLSYAAQAMYVTERLADVVFMRSDDGTVVVETRA